MLFSERQCFKWSAKGGAELAMDDRVTGGHEGVRYGERVSPSPVGVGPGEGAVPLPRNFFLEFCPWEWCILVHLLCYFLQSTGIIITQNTVKQRQSRLGLHTHPSPQHK